MAAPIWPVPRIDTAYTLAPLMAWPWFPLVDTCLYSIPHGCIHQSAEMNYYWKTQTSSPELRLYVFHAAAPAAFSLG